MALSKRKIAELLELVGITRDDEIDCDACLSRVAEFVERQLEGKSLPEGLEAVEHHLAVCAECREEYEALQKALSGLGS